MKILSMEGSREKPASFATMTVSGVAVGILELLSHKFGVNGWAVIAWAWEVVPGQPADNILKLTVRVRHGGEVDYYISFNTPMEWDKLEVDERRNFVARMMSFIMTEKGAEDLRIKAGLSFRATIAVALVLIFGLLILLRRCR